MSNVLVIAKAKYSFLVDMEDAIKRAIAVIVESIEVGGKLLICGNGGSAADADHIVGEMLKGFIQKRPLSTDLKEKIVRNGGDVVLADTLQASLPAISLAAHTALITAVINDMGGEYIYAQQVLGLGKSGDVFLGISTSGNSRNVYNAAVTARALGLTTLCLTGGNSGKLGEVSDIHLCVDETETWMIQDKHSTVYHIICAAVEEYFFKEP
jgi:D-sedoheptulose 7-phosphate isomerase